MGKADLHLHTTARDGMMSPTMLMNYIAACTDLDLVAITDLLVAPFRGFGLPENADDPLSRVACLLYRWFSFLSTENHLIRNDLVRRGPISSSPL
jgi:hypothetical protein